MGNHSHPQILNNGVHFASYQLIDLIILLVDMGRKCTSLRIQAKQDSETERVQPKINHDPLPPFQQITLRNA